MQNQNLAAIDLGTNSCRLLIADSDGNRLFKTAISTRMGEGMSANNCFTEAAIKRGIDCFCEFRRKMDEYGVQKYRAIATAACRMSENGTEFVETVRKTANINLEVIDGYEEARLNLLGAISNAENSNAEYVIVYDLGGGSTEITLATKELTPRILHTVSIPWGARNSSEKFEINEYDAAKAANLAAEISKYSRKFVVDAGLEKYRDKLCFIATSSTSLRLAHLARDWKVYERERADGEVVTTEEFDRGIAQVRNMTFDERLNDTRIGASRADIFNAACVIFSQIYRDLGAKEIVTSFKSAVEGIITELKDGAN